MQSFFYDFYLGVRKFLLYILGLTIVLGLTVYFIANSPWVVKIAAEKFAPDYNISYSRIYGNVVTGVEIDDLAYNKQPLAKSIKLKWNPNGLVKKEITVNRLVMNTLNVENINQMVNAFATPTQSTDENTSFDFSVYVGESKISLAPLKQNGITIETLVLKMKNVYYADELVNVDRVECEADTNITKVKYTGHIKKNVSNGELILSPKEQLFIAYNLPLRSDAIKRLKVGIEVSEETLKAKLKIQAKELLKKNDSNFNIDINNLETKAIYLFENQKLLVDTTASISTPYAQNIELKNLFKMNDNITYMGTVYIKKLLGIEEKFLKPFNNIMLDYKGTKNNIEANMNTNDFKGLFVSNDFKTALFQLDSKDALLLNEYIQLPAELNQSKANLHLEVPLNFELENTVYNASVKIDSNVLNVDTNLSYTDILGSQSVIKIPTNSLLRTYSEELNWEYFNRIETDVTLVDNTLKVLFSANKLNIDSVYEINSTKLAGKLYLDSLDVTIDGMTKDKLTVDTHIKNIPTLVQAIKEVYILEEMPKIDGSAKISMMINDLSSIDIKVQSPKVVYHADRSTEYSLEDIDFLVHANESNISLENYHVRFDENKIFSSKPSQVLLKNNILSVEPFWINDALKTQGSYDLKTQKGKIVSQAKKLDIQHKIIDLSTRIDVTTVLDGNKTSVNGKIAILGGNLHYDLDQKSFTSDSDILIVQEIKADEPSVFMDNLSADVQVITKKALIYKKGPVDIQANVEVGVHKAEHAPLLILGTVEVVKGGSYLFQNKKFTLEQSFIHFTGDPNKPILDMKVLYKALNHLVTIAITGSTEFPNIQFSSKPSLSKEQILSLILFDTIEGAGTNSGDDMMKMMGGAMAKSALNDLGVKIDHLVLGEGDSVEVGKKLTEKITIIYVNDIVSGVKLKYEHGKRAESVISADEESQSYDIIYKRDF